MLHFFARHPMVHDTSQCVHAGHAKSSVWASGFPAAPSEPIPAADVADLAWKRTAGNEQWTCHGTLALTVRLQV